MSKHYVNGMRKLSEKSIVIKYNNSILFVLFLLFAGVITASAQQQMMYGDTTRVGLPYSKDPHVVKFNGRYLMYYSIPPRRWNNMEGWNIGIAESKDLVNWQKAGEITPEAGLDYEAKGLCAPCALAENGRVHLFYQTYGNGPKDAICHAVSDDGLHFERDKTNPIYHPEPSSWSCGRAIDAEVVKFKGKYFLYFATRDPEFKIQKLGVAVADGDTDFSRKEWKTAVDKSILYPHLEWEGECIEAPSACVRGDTLFLFYAGAYNNAPQQVGVAWSKDGINFTRCYHEPIKPCGEKGEWNSSESGHPHLFKNDDGRTFLFYQGNNDNGRTWKITNEEVVWTDRGWPRMISYEGRSPFVFDEYDDMPYYPEGDESARKFISEHLTYPAEAKKKGIEGRVLVSFIVDLDDSASDYKIEHSVHPALDAEAMRVVKLMKFKAGRQQIKPVRYYMPVGFGLTGNNK
jgi:TonB family protein